MDTLEDSIAASCPLAFAGATGALFVKAVTALVAAQCGIVNEKEWPRDEADEIFMKHETSLTFDFIIIGAGTAGSIVASRLSSYFPSKSVLLIEAGHDPGLESEVPALLFLNQKTDIDWHYQTYPDGESCLGFNNKSCVWSKGRAMGGSSSINAMLYIRGHPNDYDNWQKEGNNGWSYKDLEPYFEKAEKELNLDYCKLINNDWYDIIKGAWNELGFKYLSGTDEAHIGTRITKLLTRDGKRLNTAKIYLTKRNNLYVMKRTTVQKIIIDVDTNIASRVVISHENGKVMEIGVNTEIILSAGSIATPQILMLSGIGPKPHLDEKKVKCVVDLPVGKNLQDHILLPIFFKTNLHTQLTPNDLILVLQNYMMSRTGPLSNIGITDFMGFINSGNGIYPDIQFLHTHFTQNDNFMLKSYLIGIGFNTEIIKLIEELNKESDLLGIYPTLLHPKSKGIIELTDTEPQSKPIIKSNYFQDARDLEVLIEAINFLKKLADTNSFKALGLEMAYLKIEACSNSPLGTIDYWKCYIRHMASTIYHPVGTVKMAPKENGGVVNEDLLIHGLRNVRVMDASVMPTITSGNTMSPTMAIAEKGADIIRFFHKNRKDEL